MKLVRGKIWIASLTVGFAALAFHRPSHAEGPILPAGELEDVETVGSNQAMSVDTSWQDPPSGQQPPFSPPPGAQPGTTYYLDQQTGTWKTGSPAVSQSRNQSQSGGFLNRFSRRRTQDAGSVVPTQYEMSDEPALAPAPKPPTRMAPRSPQTPTLPPTNPTPEMLSPPSQGANNYGSQGANNYGSQGANNYGSQGANSYGSPAAAELRHSAPCSTCDRQPAGFVFELGPMIMQPLRSGLDIGTSNLGITGTAVGNTETLQYQWAGGIKLGIGYQLEEGRDLECSYTYLHSSESRTVSDGVLFNSFVANNMLAQSIEGSIGLDYDVVDLSFAQWMSLNNRLALRLGFGPRLANIDQNYNLDANTITLANTAIGTTDLITETQRYRGYGLRLGGESHWVIGPRFSFFAKAAGSLMYGEYEVNQSEVLDATQLSNITYDFNAICPVLDLSVGGNWRWRCMDISLAYEFVNWFSLTSSVDTANPIHSADALGSLGMSGFVLKFAYSF